MVRQWRNSDAVAAGMITNQTVTVAEHEAWLSGVLDSDECEYWVICADGRPAGLVYVYDIDRARGECRWGFYNADVDLRGRGVVRSALSTVLDHVFGELGIDLVNAEVLEGNDASLGLHQRLGFTVTDRRRGAVSRDDRDLDLIRLMLEAEDWRGRNGGDG